MNDCGVILQVSAGCRYAFTACMAAAFFQNKYSTEGSHEVALLPVIDLLNHNSTNQVRLQPFVSFNVSSLSQEKNRVDEVLLESL